MLGRALSPIGSVRALPATDGVRLAAASVRFRPKADIRRNPGFAGRAESVTDFFVGCYLEDLGLVGVVHPYYVSATYTIH